MLPVWTALLSLEAEKPADIGWKRVALALSMHTGSAASLAVEEGGAEKSARAVAAGSSILGSARQGLVGVSGVPLLQPCPDQGQQPHLISQKRSDQGVCNPRN